MAADILNMSSHPQKHKSLQKYFDIAHLVENFTLIILVKKLSLFHQ
jgi:hypothetical protein